MCVGWPGWQKQSRFFHFWPEARFAAQVENDVSHPIVSDDSIAPSTAPAAVVAELVEHVVAQRTEALLVSVWHANIKFHLPARQGRPERTRKQMQDRALGNANSSCQWSQLESAREMQAHAHANL